MFFANGNNNKIIALLICLLFYSNSLEAVIIDLLLTGDGDASQMTPLGGGDNYVEVDEHVLSADDDTTYVSETTSDDADLYHIEDLSVRIPPFSEIIHIQVAYRAKRVGGTSGAAREIIRSNGTDSAGGNNALSTSYQGFSVNFTTDPDTSSTWTIAALDAVQIGCQARSLLGGATLRNTATAARISLNLAANAFQWNGGQSTDPNVATNWTTNGAFAVPGNTELAFIGVTSQNYPTYGGVTHNYEGLMIVTGAQATFSNASLDLDIDNEVTIDGTLTISAGDIDIGGFYKQSHTGDLDMSGGNIHIAGDMYVLSSGDFLTMSAGVINLDGGTTDVYIETSDAIYQLDIEAGTRTLKTGIEIKNALNVNAGTLNVDQALTLQFNDSASISVTGDLDFNGTSGNVVVLEGSTAGTDKFSMTINNGGDLHATYTNFNDLATTGIVFNSTSIIGGNSGAGSGGSAEFRNVTFNNIASNGIGMDLTGADTANNIPDILRDIQFNGTSPGVNVAADGGTPTVAFHMTNNTSYGTLGNDGESADSDASDKIIWNFPSTYVQLAYFKTECPLSGDGVDLKWSTLSEFDSVGFNVYRATSREGPFIRLNDDIIPSVGNTEFGSDYGFFDKLPKRNAIRYYQLEEVDIEGKKTVFGPVCTDWDRDGIPDDWEEINGLDYTDAGDAALDSDGDGLSNLEEYQRGLDPHNTDTDGDGIDDSLDEGTPPAPIGILAGRGLKMISNDRYGLTLELEPGQFIKNKVLESYVGWSVSDENRFYQRYKVEELYHVYFSDLPQEYEIEEGFPRLPIVNVLINIAQNRKVEAEYLIEDWSGNLILDKHIAPVPQRKDIPAVRLDLTTQMVNSTRVSYQTQTKDISTLTGYEQKRIWWSGLFGGRAHEEAITKKVEVSELVAVEQEVQVEQEVYEEKDTVEVRDIYERDTDIYLTDDEVRSEVLTIGEKSVVGENAAQLLSFHPVKYNPVTGSLKYLKKLRVRINYVYDDSLTSDDIASDQASYQAKNAGDPPHLSSTIAQKVEIKIKKPGYSDDGDLNDKGLYKVTINDLSGTGYDTTEIENNPGGFHLYQGRTELSLKEVYLGNDIDHFLFYADSGQNETLFNETVTFYGYYDASVSSKRWGSLSNESSYDQELTSFDQRIRYEKQSYFNYMPEYPEDSLFVHNTYVYRDQKKSYTFNTPGLSSTGTVEFKTRQWARYDFTDAGNDQGVYLTLNSSSSPYASPQWPGASNHIETNTFNASEFNDGSNTLEVEGYYPDGAVTTMICRMDWMEVVYPRDLEAISDEILITTNKSGTNRFDVSGFTDVNAITVLDVSDASTIQEITNPQRDALTQRIKFNHKNNSITDSVVIPNFLRLDTDFGGDDPNGRGNIGFGYETGSPKLTETQSQSVPSGYYSTYYSLGGTEPEEGLQHQGVRLLLTDISQARSIQSAKLVSDSSHVKGKTDQVDHLIIIDESLKGTESQRLIDHLNNQGQVVEEVTYQELVQAYTYGEYTSSAMKLYIKERFLTAPLPKPQYVTIIGSGNVNTKGQWNYPKELALIPSVMVKGGIKASVTDWPLTKVSDDIFPDLAIGRLDCGTTSELADILDKVINYETASDPSQYKALLVADHDPAYVSDIFEQALDEIIGYLETPWIYESLYRDNYLTYDPLTDGIVDNLSDQEVTLLFYNGHGNFDAWGYSLFFNSGKLNSLSSGHYLPVVIEANCMASDFFHTAIRSLGTHWLQKANKGAVGIIGTTSRTDVNDKDPILDAIARKLLIEGFDKLGQALQRAKIEQLTTNPKDQVRAVVTQHLLGLPSLEVKKP